MVGTIVTVKCAVPPGATLSTISGEALTVMLSIAVQLEVSRTISIGLVTDAPMAFTMAVFISSSFGCADLEDEQIWVS